ncbi:hypothetical protein Tco_1257538, partial [Tanacetum coccineum]
LDLKGYFYSNCAECNMDKKVFQMLVSCLKASLFAEFIPTQYQLADIFTKPLDEPTFNRLIVELDLHEHLGFCRLRWKIDADEDYNNLFSIT